MTARPPLLPEDLRFTGLASAQVPEALLPWLTIVFRTWGGFTVALGLCLLGLAGYVFTRRELWFIAVLFVVALATALLLLRGLPR